MAGARVTATRRYRLTIFLTREEDTTLTQRAEWAALTRSSYGRLAILDGLVQDNARVVRERRAVILRGDYGPAAGYSAPT